MKHFLVNAIVAIAIIGINSCKKDDTSLDQRISEKELLETSSSSGTLKADFNYQVCDSSKYPITVKFTNTSTGSNHYEWSFGNGAVSKAKSPSATYAASITYTVKLVASNGKQSSSKEKVINIPYLNKSVRIIYITPNDKDTNQVYLNALRQAAPNLRDWYKGQMDGKTYRVNNPLITVLKSSHNTMWFDSDNGNSGTNPAYYFFYNTYNDVRELLGTGWDTDKYAYTIYVDAPGGTGAGTLGFCTLPEHDLKGISGQSPQPVSRWIGGWGHELGHAFGLPHPDTQIDNAIMSIGYLYYPNCIFLPSDKTILANSGFFFKN